MDPVLVGLRDVNEHAGQELEGVDDTVVVVVMSGLGLVEDELGVWMIAKPGEVHRRAHQIAGKLVESLGVAGVDGGVVMNAEAGMAPR